MQAGIQRVRANFTSQVKKGKLPQEKADALMKKLHGTVTYNNFKSVDMVSVLNNVVASLKLAAFVHEYLISIHL